MEPIYRKNDREQAQLKTAFKLIKQMHPLYNKVSFLDAVPLIGSLFRSASWERFDEFDQKLFESHDGQDSEENGRMLQVLD